MKQQFQQFLLRWAVCSAGLWISSLLFSTVELGDKKAAAVVLGGLSLALANAVLKPLVILLSLPAIMLSLGLFTVIINGLMVVIASWLYGPLEVETFGAAVLTGVVIGLLNFIITKLLEGRSIKLHEKHI
ncbi:phage holin family protein [Candidatus Saccharibacteria bacterium]|nr:phage holin family protein [Candidatus Saccharibacteria bacterium]